MLELDVNMADAKIREALAQAEKAVSPESAAKVAAEAGADVVRSHFVDLSEERHRPGQRINYYLQAADSVLSETDGGTAKIRIPHAGIAQRYYGGTIEPTGRTSPVTGKPVTRLAIGLKGTPGAGHVPADFSGLFLITKKGVRRGDKSQHAFLGVKAGDNVRRLFVLVDAVTQGEDPSVLPDNQTILDAAAEGILDLYDAVTEGNHESD